MTTAAAKRETLSSRGQSPAPREKKVRNTPSLVPLDLGRTSPIASFIDIVEPARTQDDLILSPENLRVLSFISDEHQNRDTLRRHGVVNRNRLLFCGPPGCGKTLAAEVFANEVGLDLYIVRLDGLISSFLGETAANLRTVVDAAERRPCVLFFDEFDALAQARSDITGHGELRRFVNSLLMMIERFQGRGFLIAATNLESMLDDALWRRFDEVVLFDRPTSAKARAMLNLKTRNFKPSFDIAAKAERLKGFSFAEIDRLCTQAIKCAILAKRKTLSEADFDLALKDELRRRKIQKRLAPEQR